MQCQLPTHSAADDPCVAQQHHTASVEVKVKITVRMIGGHMVRIMVRETVMAGVVGRLTFRVTQQSSSQSMS